MTTNKDDPEAANHPLLEQVQSYAAAVLRPRALDTDHTGVTRQTIRDLAALGALNHPAPATQCAAAGLVRKLVR